MKEMYGEFKNKSLSLIDRNRLLFIKDTTVQQSAVFYHFFRIFLFEKSTQKREHNL